MLILLLALGLELSNTLIAIIIEKLISMVRYDFLRLKEQEMRLLLQIITLFN